MIDETISKYLDAHNAASVNFDIAQATAKSLFEMLWNIGDGIQECDINDIGRSGYDAVSRMVNSFEAMQKLDKEGRKGVAS